MVDRYKVIVVVALVLALAFVVGDVVAKPGDLPPP